MSLIMPLPNENLLPDPGDPFELDSVDYGVVNPPNQKGHDNGSSPPPDTEEITGMDDTIVAALVDYAVPTLRETVSLSATLSTNATNIDLPTPRASGCSTDSSHQLDSSDLTSMISENAIWVPNQLDVLSGRGAHVNSHEGNKRFRAFCFVRKAMFDAANHAAKQRIATDVWSTCVATYRSRYLKRHEDKGPWFEQPFQQAVLKAAQVMRDYRRPDRLLSRASTTALSKKRSRALATPMDDAPISLMPIAPIIENPMGVHENDVICGRGAVRVARAVVGPFFVCYNHPGLTLSQFVNGHTGNHRLRELGLGRKAQFDAGTYAEKRFLATEIVAIIKGLMPAGRFLRKVRPSRPLDGDKTTVQHQVESDWEELDLEQSIHKACQVMRDIARQDRKERDERREARKQRDERQGRLCMNRGLNKELMFMSESDLNGPRGSRQNNPAESTTEEDVAAVEEKAAHHMLV